MKNEHKIILVKSIIALSGILLVLTLVIGITSEIQVVGTKSYYFYKNLSLIILLSFFLSGTIMMILMWKIDIRPQKTKSEKYKIKTTNYNDLKKYLFEAALDDGYESRGTFKTDKYSIDYVLKNKLGESYIIVLLNLDELTEDIYKEYKDNYFEKFGSNLLNTNQVKVTNNIHVTYIICVDRVTKTFSQYTESNVKQYWGRFNLPVGVSFASGTLYISTQQDGLFKGRYKKLVKNFKGYIKNQLFIEK